MIWVNLFNEELVNLAIEFEFLRQVFDLLPVTHLTVLNGNEVNLLFDLAHLRLKLVHFVVQRLVLVLY